MNILIADDEQAARYALSKTLRANGRTLSEATDGGEVISAIREQNFDLVFLDLNMPIQDGLSVLKELEADSVSVVPEIIVVTANDSISKAIECIRHGAVDYLTKPYDIEHVRSIARRAEERVRLRKQVQELQSQSGSLSRFGSILGISPAMKKLFGQIDRAAKVALPVLIRGESGTGKELVARELHGRGAQCNGPMIAVNTAAIAESLIESELFGHIKGAFTGADRPREGVFRQSDGGTLFLDEIGDMPYSVQTRLLRVLQESVVQPVGSEQCIRVDVRIVSATHQDLEQAIADKIFRQDLYYRLKGIELTIPPLRSRHEDILMLAREFVGPEREFSDDAVSGMMGYSWPGNVRELKQRVQSAAAMSEADRIHGVDLGFVGSERSLSSSGFEQYLGMPLVEAHQRLLEDYDRVAVERALAAENGNITLAAKRLGMHRQSLQQKLKNLLIRPS
ncbi:MAG: sigma-54 dependent transcriptional regulator [Pirellula sp.]